jgi:alpha-1,6-mannosyltransferase
LVDIAVVDALRSTTLGAVVSKAAVVIGIALLLQSWLLLGHDVMRGRVRDLRRLWLTLGAWSLPLIVTPPLFSRDVYSYFAQGKLMVAGINPYTHGSSAVPGWFNDGVDPLWAETPTPYGQFFLLLERGVAQFVGPHPYSATLAFRLIAVGGVVMLGLSIPRLAFVCGIEPSKAMWLGLLNPLVLMHFISGAHNDALMVGLIAAGLALAASHQGLLGAILVTLAGSVKPIGLVALPFVGLLWARSPTTSRRIMVRWALTAAIALGILGAFAVITGTGLGWLSALSTPGAVRTWLSPPTAVGMSIGGLLSLVGIDQTDAIVAVCRLIGTAVTVGVIIWLCAKPWGRTPIRGAAIVLFMLVALGPVIQPWYLLWSIPLFAVSGLNKTEFRVVLIGSVGFSLYGLITSSATQDSLLQIPDLVAVVIVAVVIAILLAVSPRERRLLLGDTGHDHLLPEDGPSRARAGMLVVRRADS